MNLQTGYAKLNFQGQFTGMKFKYGEMIKDLTPTMNPYAITNSIKSESNCNMKKLMW